MWAGASLLAIKVLLQDHGGGDGVIVGGVFASSPVLRDDCVGLLTAQTLVPKNDG